MVTPYLEKCGHKQDSYNYHQSQLWIKIECACGMFTEKWKLLCLAMPCSISLKNISLVFCLVKLHNFLFHSILVSNNVNTNHNDGVGAITLLYIENLNESQQISLDFLEVVVILMILHTVTYTKYDIML